MGFAFTLTPEKAVRYFESLGYAVPDNWPQQAREAAAKGQSIAGIYRQDIVGEMYRSMTDAAREGVPFAQWRQNMLQRFGTMGLHWDKAGDLADTTSGEVLGTGLTQARLETVYRTNMQNAFMAGRWQELQNTKAYMPYLQYTAVMDSRTRPRHRELHGLIYHIDDVFWDYFYPPNGFNCRCTVTAYSARDLEKRGLAVSEGGGQIEDVHRVVNKRGDTVPAKALRLPDGRSFSADAGFEGNVGKRHLAQLGQLQLQRAVDLPPRVASMAVGEALKQPTFFKALSDQFKQRFDYLQAGNHGTNQIMHVGVLPLALLEALERRNILPQSAVISMGDADITHALRELKTNAGKALPKDTIRNVPELLMNPDAVYLQKKDSPPTLWFIYETEQGKLVLLVDKPNRKTKEVMNIVRTGGKIRNWKEALSQHELIWGNAPTDM
nr:phage minor head protein [Neisseria sp. HSC-16F19]